MINKQNPIPHRGCWQATRRLYLSAHPARSGLPSPGGRPRFSSFVTVLAVLSGLAIGVAGRSVVLGAWADDEPSLMLEDGDADPGETTSPASEGDDPGSGSDFLPSRVPGMRDGPAIRSQPGRPEPVPPVHRGHPNSTTREV